MTYEDYMKLYGHCFFHKYLKLKGEPIVYTSLQDLLNALKYAKLPCPNEVEGGFPMKVTIHALDTLDLVERELRNDYFASDDYEIPKEGWEFLRKCFNEYNANYATPDLKEYYHSIGVTVPEHMKYKLEECFDSIEVLRDKEKELLSIADRVKIAFGYSKSIHDNWELDEAAEKVVLEALEKHAKQEFKEALGEIDREISLDEVLPRLWKKDQME